MPSGRARRPRSTSTRASFTRTLCARSPTPRPSAAPTWRRPPGKPLPRPRASGPVAHPGCRLSWGRAGRRRTSAARASHRRLGATSRESTTGTEPAADHRACTNTHTRTRTRTHTHTHTRARARATCRRHPVRPALACRWRRRHLLAHLRHHACPYTAPQRHMRPAQAYACRRKHLRHMVALLRLFVVVVVAIVGSAVVDVVGLTMMWVATVPCPRRSFVDSSGSLPDVVPYSRKTYGGWPGDPSWMASWSGPTQCHRADVFV